MQKTLLLLICIVLLSPRVFAQQGRQYSFSHYNTTNGSVSNQVNTVVQDGDGYIWTGTTDGLQRYDGNRYKLFQHRTNDSLSLPANPIWQLKLDKKKNLWVLLANGRIGIFNTNTFKFHEVVIKVHNEKAKNAGLKKIFIDEQGNVMLLLSGWALLTWNESRNEFSEDYSFISLPSGMRIADVAQQPGTLKYWISLYGEGFVIYNHATSQWSYAGHNSEKEPAIDRLAKIPIAADLLFDNKGRLWFDYWGGLPILNCYDTRRNQFVLEKYDLMEILRTYYEVSGFYMQNDGTIWVRGLGVLAQFNEQENKFQIVYNGNLNGRGIYYDAVHDLYEDREKNLWVATRNNGLYRFNPSTEFFVNISHINRITGKTGSGSVLSFAPTRWGTTLVGTWGDGIFQYDRDFNLIPTNIKGIDNILGPTIWNMFLSSDSNTIWMSAQPGIYAIDQSTRSARFYNPPALQNRTARQIVEDKYGNLWIGMQTIGLFKWTKNKDRKFAPENVAQFKGFPPVQINKLAVDHKGWIWVGTASRGVYVIDPANDSVVLHISKDPDSDAQLIEDEVTSLLLYSDSLVVIGTSTTLNLYDRLKNKVLPIGGSENFSGVITSLQRDSNYYIWASTSSGLYRVNGYLRMFVRFTREDGIDNDNFTLSASTALPDGRLFFGSSNQFITFDPKQIRINTLIPGAKITDFKVMNKSLRIDSLLALDRIRLGPNSNSFSIDFSPLSYSNAYVIRYKMEGLDKDWKIADLNNQAVYSYLPARSYTLLVETVDAEGKAGSQTLQLRIRIAPPFWKTWWFYSSIIILIGGLLFWYDRERTKRKKAIQDMRANISDNLHGEINTALNNINILSEMARLRTGKDPVKVEGYIDQIHDKSHNMIIAMDDMLWSLDPANDNMEKTVDRMREYIDSLNNRHGVYIDMLADKNVEQLKLNMMLRHEALLLFKEGIQNLVYAGVSICHIHMGLEKARLVVTMQFDTETCDMQQLHNLFQRQDMEKRLDAMRANLDIQVHKNSSMFVLKIPIE